MEFGLTKTIEQFDFEEINIHELKFIGGGCGTAITGGDTSSSGGDDNNNGIEGNLNVTLPSVNVTIGGSETTYYLNGNIKSHTDNNSTVSGSWGSWSGGGGGWWC